MAINLNVTGNTQPLEAAVQAAVNRIRKTPIKITVDDKGATQPLGNMKRGADEFSKSMEAANARIIAFGASMAIINGVSDAFKAMVKNVVEVEKSLADINVVMGLSANNLDKFSSSLFKVAKETAASFDVAAAAATEYARQGLKVEETLKRTKDALILTRLTGMDSANAVKALTAAMNTYGDQIKDTTQLVSKFAAVDVRFAVSAEDFADAISRTGQAAKSAGVDIDELVGLVTAAQQKTARGGKVIGNSFKTIFTRIGRTDTLNQLENLGIAVRDVEGKTIGAKRILTDLANTFDHLSEAQKAQIAQTVGGVFQINVLKAVLSDAAKQNGILANATQISAGATDEAITKNEQLRQTMAAMASETGLALKEVSARIGEIMLAPGMEKILNIVKSMTEGVGDMLGTGEGAGNTFAKGFLKGLGNIITGPGLVVMVAVFTKLLVKAVQYARDSLKSLIGVTSEAQKQKAIQTSLVTLFGQNAALNKEMLRTDISRTEKEKIILSLLKAQVMEANALNSLTKQMSTTLYSKGYGANLAPRRGRAAGHIPNFAHPERAQAAQGGYAAGNIRSMNMPGEGPIIYNSAETVRNFAGFKQPAIMPPKSSKAGQNYQQAFGNIHGFDPYAAGGYIPNYAGANLNALKYQALEKVALSGKRWADPSNTTILEGAWGKGSVPDQKVIFSNTSDLYGTGVKTFADFQKKIKNQGYIKTALAKSKAAMLVPPEDKGDKYAKYGTGGNKLIWPVHKLNIKDKDGPDSIHSEMFDKAKKIGIGYATSIASVLGGNAVTGAEFDEAFKKAEGTKGALSAATGAVFESAVNAALQYSADDSSENQGDFDVRGRADAGRLSQVFKGFRADMMLADYKNNSTSSSNRKSFYDKLIKEFGKKQTFLKTAASGFIPNFADPLSDAIGREKAAGVPVSQIRVGSHGALMSKGNPLGLGVTNTHDEPNGLRDVFGAANGYVPNYAPPQLSYSDIGSGRSGGSSAAQAQMEKNAREYNKSIEREIKLFKRREITHEQLILNTKDLNQKYNVNSAATQRVSKGMDSMLGPVGRVSKAFSSANKKFEKNMFGKFFGSTGGQMGLMMGAPMAADFAKDAIGGKVGAAAGGFLQGAGSGAAMGMMFGPLGTAIGAAAGGLYGLFDASKKLEEAQDEAAKAAKDRRISEGTQLGASLAKGFSSPKEISFASSLNKSEYFGGGIRAAGRSSLRIKDPRELMTSGRKGSFAIADKGMAGQLAKLVNSSETGEVIDDAINSLFSKKATTSNPTGRVNASHMITTLRDSFKGSSLEGQQDEILKMAKSNAVKSGTGLDKASFRKAMTDQSVAKMGTEARKEMLLESLFAIKKADPKEKINYQGKDFSPDQLIEEVGDDPDKIRAAYKSMLDTYDKMKHAEAKKTEGIIIQLNLQKAQIAAQQAAAVKQLEIKENYSKISDNLKFEEKLMGSLMTDQQKAQSKYLQAINKAKEAYSNAAASADNQLRTGILTQLKGSDPLQAQLKKALRMDDTSSFQDISKKVGSLTGKELKATLERISSEAGDNSTIRKAINELLSLEITKMENILSLAQKQKDVSTSQAGREREINGILAGRAEIIKDLERKNRMSSEGIRSSQKIRGFTDQVAAARRLNAVGPGYQTGRERESFAMSEKRFKLESKITTLEENRGKTLAGLSADKLGYEMENQRLAVLDSETYSGEYSSHEDIEEYKALVASTEERRRKLEEIEQKIKNIKAETKTEIESAKELLDLEKERLKIKREHTTGPGAFSRGFKDTQGEMFESLETFNYELGDVAATNFRDGIAEAMKVGLNGAEDLGEALMQVASNFLSAIQNAFLQNAANAIVSAIPMPGRSRGGSIRNYSRGGGVPAMVSNGEYVMGRDAVAKYGGAFMHGLNSGGTVPGFSNGGSPGSALASNFGGGRGYTSGKSYQSRAMSGFFYNQSGNVGLQDDEQSLMGVLAEEERARQTAAAKKAKKKAFWKQLLGTALSAGVSYGIGKLDLGKPLAGGSPDPAGGTRGQFLGGPIRKYASGGHISGKTGIDQIPAMLSEGEYVIRASSARQIGRPMLDRINAGKFNDGGSVSPLNSTAESGISGGNTNNINISINMESGKVKSNTSDSSSSGQNPVDRSNSQQSSNELAEKIKQQVVSVIVEEQRPGGLLSD